MALLGLLTPVIPLLGLEPTRPLEKLLLALPLPLALPLALPLLEVPEELVDEELLLLLLLLLEILEALILNSQYCDASGKPPQGA